MITFLGLGMDGVGFIVGTLVAPGLVGVFVGMDVGEFEGNVDGESVGVLQLQFLLQVG